MESKIKSSLSPEQIDKILQHAFPDLIATNYIITELSEGSYNMVYKIEINNRKDVILKVAPSRQASILSYEKGIMRTEVKAMNLVKACTNLPIPIVYFYDDSKTICDSDYFLMEKIEGLSFDSVRYDMNQEMQEDILFQIGKYNKTINNLVGDYFGYPGNSTLQSNRWDDAFSQILEQILEDAEKMHLELGVHYEEIRLLFGKFSYVLSDVKESRLIHWDLWDGNVLVNNGQVSGIIDFERVLWGDPLMEYYFHDIFDEDKINTFLNGYGCLSFSHNDLLKRALYNIYMFIVIIVDYVNRGLDDEGLYTWAKEMLLQMVNYLQKKIA